HIVPLSVQAPPVAESQFAEMRRQPPGTWASRLKAQSWPQLDAWHAGGATSGVQWSLPQSNETGGGNGSRSSGLSSPVAKVSKHVVGLETAQPNPQRW